MKEESYRIRGAIYAVYREMGCRFLEAVYQECLALELQAQGIPYVAQKDLSVSFKGQPLAHKYRADFVCYDEIVLEIKAVGALAPEHIAQLQNYLRATRLRLGFVVNFGHHPKAEIQRIVM